MDSSEKGPTFYRLFEASGVDGQALNVKVFNCVFIEKCSTFENGERQT